MNPRRIAYLGPPGTFGEEAAMRFDPAATLVACPSHAAVARAVESGEAEAGVLAIENSINGGVAETLDIFIHESPLQIQQELLLPVSYVLAGAEGADPATAKAVFGHPQALGQCRHYLETHLPQAAPQASLSNAAAVQEAMSHGPDAVAIGTARAAELYGARVLASGIRDSENNITRFVLIGRDSPPPTGRDRTSIAFTFAEDRPGSLAGVLNVFAERGINCSKIESRPTREVLGEYVFLIDFDLHREDPLGREALEAVRRLTAEVKVFGSYPRAPWPRKQD